MILVEWHIMVNQWVSPCLDKGAPHVFLHDKAVDLLIQITLLVQIVLQGAYWA